MVIRLSLTFLQIKCFLRHAWCRPAGGSAIPETCSWSLFMRSSVKTNPHPQSPPPPLPSSGTHTRNTEHTPHPTDTVEHARNATNPRCRVRAWARAPPPRGALGAAAALGAARPPRTQDDAQTEQTQPPYPISRPQKRPPRQSTARPASSQRSGGPQSLPTLDM